MEKQTKQQILEGFLVDVKNVLKKVEANEATAREYQLLEEYFQLAGVEQSTVEGVLRAGNFSGWLEFYEERKKPSSEQNIIAVKSTLGQIKGIGRAVMERLQAEIRKLDWS